MYPVTQVSRSQISNSNRIKIVIQKHLMTICFSNAAEFSVKFSVGLSASLWISFLGCVNKVEVTKEILAAVILAAAERMISKIRTSL